MELNANIHIEGGSYWADVPKLPGCFAAGDSLDELFDSLREGIELYLNAEDDPGAVRPRGSLKVKSAILSDGWA